MAKTAAEHWVQSLKSKTGEIETLTRELVMRVSRPDYDTREDEIERFATQLTEKTKSFFDLFGPGQAPPALEQFAHTLDIWQKQRANPVHLIALITAYNNLGDIGRYEGTTLSFEVVLATYRDDQELERLLADLVTKLRHLVKVADAD